ncbi:hypothetical protein FNF28_01314 [Cafeteria roenbergensis]|uniref:Glutamine amidotransferase type-2 domain-containing protein n=1 Tax=Cafeteria roenbergensis TaxID=33653 RepID=A0A5A8DYH6_CAFRO|nr:hypothetical protein FNF28_01314 [Cafeteria roenbergensis]
MDADDCVHEDHPRHECGVFAAFNVDNAAKNIFFALYALQHRGQESAGIATSDRFSFNVHRGMGLVSQIFNEDTDKGRMAVAHNGQLVHEDMLRRRLLRAGTGLFTTTDSEIIAQMLARDTTDRLANIRLVYSSPTEMLGDSAAPSCEAGSPTSGSDEAALTAAAAVAEAALPSDTQSGTLREPAPSAGSSASRRFNARHAQRGGKRLVLIDDSIVRGNTLRKLVGALSARGGREEVHMSHQQPAASPPLHMGVDIGTYDELIAHGAESIDKIRRPHGADSLEYITTRGMMDAVKEGIGGHHPHAPAAAEPRHSSSSTGGEVTSSHSKLQAASDSWSMPTGHCSACFTGKYPIRLEW